MSSEQNFKFVLKKKVKTNFPISDIFSQKYEYLIFKFCYLSFILKVFLAKYRYIPGKKIQVDQMEVSHYRSFWNVVPENGF